MAPPEVHEFEPSDYSSNRCAVCRRGEGSPYHQRFCRGCQEHHPDGEHNPNARPFCNRCGRAHLWGEHIDLPPMPLFASPPAPPPPLTHDEGLRKPMPIPDTPRAVNTPPQNRQLAEVVQTIPSPRASSSVTASSFPSKDRGLPRTLARTATQTPRQCHPPRPRINQLKRKLDEVSYDYEEVVVIRKPIAALPRRAAPSLPPVQSHTSLPAPPIPYATRPTPPLAAPTPVSTAHGESQRADAVLERSDDASRGSPASAPARLPSATNTPTLAPTASTSSSKSRTSRQDDLALVFAYLAKLHRDSVVSPGATNPSPHAPQIPCPLHAVPTPPQCRTRRQAQGRRTGRRGDGGPRSFKFGAEPGSAPAFFLLLLSEFAVYQGFGGVGMRRFPGLPHAGSCSGLLDIFGWAIESESCIDDDSRQEIVYAAALAARH